MEMTFEDVTDWDSDAIFVVGLYALRIRPPRGESEELENFWDHTPGIRFLLEKMYEKANEEGYQYFLVISENKAIVENRAPVTWRYRIRRFIRERFRSRPRQREWD